MHDLTSENEVRLYLGMLEERVKAGRWYHLSKGPNRQARRGQVSRNRKAKRAAARVEALLVLEARAMANHERPWFTQNERRQMVKNGVPLR